MLIYLEKLMQAMVNTPEAQFLTLSLWDRDSALPYANDDPLGR